MSSPTKSGNGDFCAAIILAAGGSSRLGQPKQLLLIDGESLVRRTARMAVEAGCASVFVVLGCDAARMQPELEDLSIGVIHNPDWQNGIASSITTGVAALTAREPAVNNLLILVCDQSRLTTALLKELIDKHRSERATITASAYAGTTGVPAIFSRAIFPELAALSGDEGARRLIARHCNESSYRGVPWRGRRH